MVCLVTFTNDDLYVLLWNPSTRKSRTLPKLAMIHDDCESAVYGFCYDEPNDDLNYLLIFLVVLLTVDIMFPFIAQNRILGEFPFRGTLNCKQGVFANNAIHWVL